MAMVEHCYWRYDYDLRQHELVRCTPIDDSSHMERVIAAVARLDGDEEEWVAALNEEPLRAYTDRKVFTGTNLQRIKDWCEFVLGEITH